MTETEDQNQVRFELYVENKKRYIGVLEEKVPKVRERTERNLAKLRQREGVDDVTRNELENKFRASIVVAEGAVEQQKNILRFSRPIKEDDVQERERVYKNFSKEARNVIHPDLPLRFHGTSIHRAEQVIREKGLSSSVDRIGVETSYDVSDQVSVTTPRLLETTIHSYSGLIGEDRMVPAGCIFVMLPKSNLEERAGESMLMGNVSFDAEPERLVSVITSTEMKNDVADWMNNSGLDSTKVHTYDEFLESMEDLTGKINRDSNVLDNLVPYRNAK